MLNNVCLIVRLTKDAEIITAPSGTKVSKFNITVYRIFCKNWRRSAE